MRNGWLVVVAVASLGVAACGDNLNPIEGACAGVTCSTPPAATCAGDVLTSYSPTGTCDDSSGSAVCSYPLLTTDCTLTGDVCANGACVPPGDPCASTTCNTPPADECNGNTNTHYDPVGTCDGSTGTAVCSYTSTTLDCTTIDQVCSGTACVDPCLATTCDAPPADECAAGVFTDYPATGTCTSPGGVPVCEYTPLPVVDCAAMDMACDPAAGCVDACAGVSCTTPPANGCSGGVFTSYAGVGTCSSPGGVPQCDYSPATTDCTAANLACDDAFGCVDPCIGVTCGAPPGAECAGAVLTTYANPGACSSPGGVAQCDYVATTTDCAALDQVCDAGAGACVDPCAVNPCTTPPPDSCAGSVLTTYPNPGSCTAPGGVVTCVYTPLPDIDCSALDLACDPGTAACVDPCVGFSCTTPPASSCTGDVLTAFANPGTCDSPGGTPACSYAPATTDCAATGQICLGDSCQTPLAVGFCRVQFPDAVTDRPGVPYSVYGRVFVAGLTDTSGVNDPDPRLVAAVGYGPTGSDPATWTQWAPAAPNAGYGPAAPGYEANNDEYQADVFVPGPAGSVFDYAYRFSGDGGRTWTYCDTGAAGSSDGFTAPGVVTVVNPFFSEYIEGSSNNKAIEIYNPGASPLPLAGCAVDVYFNGSTTASPVALGTAAVTEIAPGDVYVLCNPSFLLPDTTVCDQTSGGANWNGDDAIALRCGTAVYDVIGQVGVDPGTEWGTGATSTADNTLVRVCSTLAGDTDGSDAFDPATQWAGYAQNAAFLGARSCPLP